MEIPLLIAAETHPTRNQKTAPFYLDSLSNGKKFKSSLLATFCRCRSCVNFKSLQFFRERMINCHFLDKNFPYIYFNLGQSGFFAQNSQWWHLANALAFQGLSFISKFGCTLAKFRKKCVSTIKMHHVSTEKLKKFIVKTTNNVF